MSVSLTIPPNEMAKLRRTMQEYATFSKKTEQQIVNDKAKDWAFRAIPETEKANSEEIARTLGRVERQRVSRSKTGKVRRRKGGGVITRKEYIVSPESFAARIINARRKDKGKPLLWADGLSQAALKMIAARRRAVSFIKSGWLAAANSIMGRATKTKDGAQIRGQPKGTAVRAREEWRPFALIVNSATKDSPAAGAVARDGLRKAIPVLIADMRKYIERKMGETMNRLNRK